MPVAPTDPAGEPKAAQRDLVYPSTSSARPVYMRQVARSVPSVTVARPAVALTARASAMSSRTSWRTVL